MWSTSRFSHPRSLADVPVNDVVSIHDICFDVIRERCTDAGLRVGDVVRVAEETKHELVLGLAAGGRVKLDRFFACFVEVGLAGPKHNTVTGQPARAIRGDPTLA